jgi:hypothetical protein
MTSQTPAAVLAISILVGAVMNMVAISDSMSIAVYAQNVENATKNSLSNNTASQSNRTSESIPPIDNLIIDHAGGTFTSLQTDKDNRTWIATGDWDLIENPLRANQSNSSSVSFNATIGLRGTDNSAGHEHKISNFTLMRSSVGSSQEGSEIVFNGTATIETDVGLYSDVPVSVRINDEGPAIVSINTQTNEVKPQWIPQGGTISVLIDEKVDDHFGSTPIYGDVKEEK